MKKFLLFCLILSVGFSYNAISDEANIEKGIYYHSALFCPEDKPIRKIGWEYDDRCGSVIAFYPIRVRDYYYHGNNESCKITSDQMEWIKKIQAETKEKEEAFAKDYSEIDRVIGTLEKHYGLLPRYCLSDYVPEHTIADHPPLTIKFEYKGDCSEEDIMQWKKENLAIKTNDEKLNERMKKYGQNCFSCDDEIDFLTDEQTCDFCPNREMKGDLCVKRKQQ